jgi:membrane fusion protein (multidrug efflux system)
MKKIIILIVSITLFVACSHTKSTDKEAELKALKSQEEELKAKISKMEAEIGVKDTAKDEKAKLVGVTTMAQQPFNHYIEVQAKVEGDDDISMGPQTPGTVKEVIAHAGDNVKTGQVLAILDDQQLLAGIGEIQSQLDLANTVYDRQKNLWDQKIGSEVQFLQTKTNKESLEKRLAAMREQWNMTRIKSPIDGVVDEVDVKVGQAVAPGLQAFRVVNLTALKIRAEVAESYISDVAHGNPAIIYFPDQNKEVKTTITYSSQVINKLNRTFNVEIKLNASDGQFHPNQVAVLKIIDYSTAKAFVVPIGAIQKSLDGEFVYVAANENNKFIAKRKIISSGMTYGGMTEVKTGLDGGDKVITNGYQNVIEGDPIRL